MGGLQTGANAPYSWSLMSSATAPAVTSSGQFLVGGGVMGDLIRSFDWSTTSLGAVEWWPQSLRTAVSILLETHFPMYIAWGPDFIQLYNDGYIPILGPTKHPCAVGLPSRETFPEIWDVIGPMFAGVMQGKAVGVTDFLLPLHRHGFLEECYFTFSYSPIRDESGNVGGILTTTTETTERVLGARRLQTLRDLAATTGIVTQQGAAWREAAQALRANAHDLPFTLLYRHDESTGQTELVAASGWNLDDPEPGAVRTIPDWPFHEVRACRHPKLVSDLRSRWARVPAGPWPDPPDTALVLPIARAGADHPYGFLVAGLSARRNLDDGYRGFLGLVADQIATAIGNARTYEEETRRAEALTELDHAKTIFFSNISHEFRTPLTLMLGPAEDLLADDSLPEGARREVEVLHRNSLRLLKLVNTLLDFSRIEAGRLKASFAPTDLSALTSDLASVFRSAIERAGLKLQVDCAPLPGPVWIDMNMWEKVILNLLSNALKFTFEGRISVEIRAQANEVVVSVSDTGVGIPEHELPRIFERFHRVEGGRGRSQEGSGIGLALVRELVGLNAGTIDVRSTPNVGTTFVVKLPLGSAHPPTEPRDDQGVAGGSAGRRVPSLYLQEALGWLPASPSNAAEDTAVASVKDPRRPALTTRARVLLVDDNADMREYLTRLFSGHGWSVKAVGDGETAFASALEQRPDLVLTDVMMPRLDGFGLLRALRDSDLKTVPVFLLSARAGEDARVEALDAGADDYLVKPFSARELLARSRALVEASRLRVVAESERRKLHSIFENAPAFICVLRGPDHVFEFHNTLYRTLVGERDLVGKSVRETFPEIAGQGFLELLDEVYCSGKPFLGQELLLKLDRKRSGVLEDTFLNFVYQPSVDLGGEVEGILVFGFDVTEQVLARRQVEALAKSESEARARAEDADRRKDEFLAMLAHELRNPLAAISMALTLMGMNEGDGSKVARQRDISARQVSTLVRLVDDLLDVSRITQGKIALRKEAVELGAIIRNGLETTRALIESRHQELSVTTAAGPLSLDGDPTRLEQVVTNLISNAAKFTPAGGQVSVRLTREDRSGHPWAVLRVKDSGRGMQRDMLERVFEPFVQVDATLDRSAGGLGIGLTLVRHLVALHGGTVTAHSEGPDKGAEFVVRLPLRARPTGAVSAGLRPAAETPRRRILLVEDNEDIREMTRDLLESLGHEVVVAKDGFEGIDLAKTAKADLALIDLGLPEIDGYEVARRIRSALGAAAPRLVALTGYGDEEAHARSREAGFDLHMVKPVSDENLAMVLSA